MLFEILGVFAGYYTRKWKKIAIILGMAFFFGLIGGFIKSTETSGIMNLQSLITYIIIPLPVNMFLGSMSTSYFFTVLISGIFITAITSMIITFVYYLIGRFAKWLLSKRDL